MSSIPLYLKIKDSVSALKDDGYNYNYQPSFNQTSTSSISFNDVSYDFKQILNSKSTNSDYINLINSPSNSSCIILMGPTSSGKTTLLKYLIHLKIKTFSDSSQTPFISSFEISNNKNIIDLLDDKSISIMSNSENNLTRSKLTMDIIKSIFKKRLTKPTKFNSNSSRSCLVITFYYQGIRSTFIDLMGNEKSGENKFANLNISSITQLMINKQNRSNNFITNYIFKSKDLKIVLNLDPFGDEKLIKSNLENIVKVVLQFKFKLQDKNVENTTRLSPPNYTKPTMSSHSFGDNKKKEFKIFKSPTKSVSSVKVKLESIIKEKLELKKTYLENVLGFKNDITEFRDESNKLFTLIKDLELKLTHLNNENKSITAEKESYVKELDQLKSQYIDIKENKSRLESDINQYESKILTQDKEIKNLKDLIRLKDDNLNGLNELKSQRDEIKKSKSALLQNINEYKSQIADVNKKLESKDKEIADLHDANSLANEQLNEKKALEAEYKSKDASIEELRSSILLKNNNISNLNQQLSENESKIRSLKEELDNANKIFKMEIASKETTIEQYKLKEIDNIGIIDSLNSQIKQLNKEHVNVVESLKEEIKKLKLNSALIEKYKSTINDLEFQRKSVIEEKNQQIESLSNELQNFKNNFKSDESSIEEFNKTINELRSQLKTTNKEKDEMIDKLKQEKLEFESQLDTKEIAIEEYYRIIHDLESRMKILNEENDKQVQHLKDKLNNIQSNESEQIKSLKDQLESLKSSSQQQLSQSDQKFKALKFELESDLAIEKQMNLDSQNKLKAKIENLKSQLKEKNESMSLVSNFNKLDDTTRFTSDQIYNDENQNIFLDNSNNDSSSRSSSSSPSKSNNKDNILKLSNKFDNKMSYKKLFKESSKNNLKRKLDSRKSSMSPNKMSKNKVKKSPTKDVITIT
ncbi:unnamed protein product [Candida verbasci]|uniref:Kinesin motor domain-containing protein n=1 Tax=Candida verbasci TaxID=1227364 RepID=A0A9W4XB74_9ASCO|nr:unnamed protein product [Candida verbasci]